MGGRTRKMLYLHRSMPHDLAEDQWKKYLQTSEF